MRTQKLTLVLALLLSASCAAAPSRETSAPPPAPTASHPEEEAYGLKAGALDAPQTLAEAEAALEQARQELYALREGGPAGAGQAAPPASAPADAEERDDAPRALESEQPVLEQQRAASPCQTPCKAFSSLLRAKDAICRLEEPRGPRCERAESIVRDAELRVQSCACPR